MERSSCAAYLICGCLVAGIGANVTVAGVQIAAGRGVPPGCRCRYPRQAGWGVEDERGNGNTQGLATRLRCAASLVHPQSRVYELGRVVSRAMPQNPFGDAPVDLDYLPTRGIPFTRHAGNGEVFSGGIGSQGTQFDALGHFGVLDGPMERCTIRSQRSR